jgi:hypothetical protein
MDEHVLNRRRVLLGTGAVAMGGVAVAASAASASASGDSGPSGSWVLSRKDDPPGDGMKVTTVLSFAAGGVLISQDISPADSPFTGTWARRGDGGFQGTMWVGQPGPAGPGKPGLTVRVRVRGSVRKDRLSGTYQYSVFDPSGAVAARGTGSFTGRPIEA